MDVTLRTPRLTLRQPVLEDAGRIARFLDNFAVAGNLSRVPYPYRLADAKSWLRTWRPVRPAGETGFVIDRDVGGLIGIHCREELKLDYPVVSIDGLELKEFDYIDIGNMIPSSGAVPVVIKSLVFPHSDASAAHRP